MIGETLGNYRIISMIGQGGMGVVYLAEHTLLGRKAAVKLLRSQVSPEAVDRFFNEARAAAMLHHPGLVEVFDFGHAKDGNAYIVMEFLEGESLGDRLEREKRLHLPVAASIARQVASALHVAHQQNIIHRDLKPENIFVVPDADAPSGVRTKVLDFGIAKLGHDPSARSVKTNSGAVFGTPRYMSPEQCKNARNVDGRADVYSLGCILYEMLLGVAPFNYDSWAELVAAHIHEVPAKPTELDPNVPVDVEPVLLKALAKKAEDRYQTMIELSQAIETVWRAHAGEAAMPLFTPPAGVKPVAGRSGAMAAASGVEDTLEPPPPASRPSRPSSEATDDTMLPSRRAGTDPTLPAEEKDVRTQPLARRPSMVGFVIGGAVVAIAGIGVLVWVLRKDPPPKDDPAFIVVDQRDPVGEPPRNPDPEMPMLHGKVIASATLDAGIAARDAAVRTNVPPRTEIDADQLTRTFGRRTAAVTACFHSHPIDNAGGISIRFQIDTQGRVTNAEVLPAAVATTPLGACLEKVARATEFGPQPKSGSFRVPIRANISGKATPGGAP